jgi:histidine triad (HIT) family protein
MSEGPVAGCLFCEIVGGARPAAIVAADDAAVAFLDARPVFKGHVLVVPRGHVATLADLPAPALAPYFGAVQRIARAVEAGLDADGTFVAMNNKVSQSVPHLHTHVVPRRRKDGLRGFFWPRVPYASDEERDDFAARIRAAV